MKQGNFHKKKFLKLDKIEPVRTNATDCNDDFTEPLKNLPVVEVASCDEQLQPDGASAFDEEIAEPQSTVSISVSETQNASQEKEDVDGEASIDNTVIYEEEPDVDQKTIRRFYICGIIAAFCAILSGLLFYPVGKPLVETNNGAVLALLGLAMVVILLAFAASLIFSLLTLNYAFKIPKEKRPTKKSFRFFLIFVIVHLSLVFIAAVWRIIWRQVYG